MERKYLSVAEVILLTGLGRTKVYEEINSGRLDAKKCGRRTLISKASFEDWEARLDSYVG